MSYITTADIKANIAQGFSLQDYILEADEEIKDLAEQLGVRNTADIADPLHYKVKRYGIVYILMRLSQDKIGALDLGDMAGLEKYTVSYQMYKKELESLKEGINFEMITGTVNEIGDRAIQSGNIFRA